MENGRVIISADRFDLIAWRLAHQIIERHADMSKMCLIGIQERGVHLAHKLRQKIEILLGQPSFKYGKLDITFYRDDFRMREIPIRASATEIDFSIDKKHVILVDDVLYTGRTVHAAIAALQDFGRPDAIEMLCMIDRRFNRHFPIKADYSGMAVDALDEAYVRVKFAEVDGLDEVRLYGGRHE